MYIDTLYQLTEADYIRTAAIGKLDCDPYNTILGVDGPCPYAHDTHADEMRDAHNGHRTEFLLEADEVGYYNANGELRA